MAALGSVVRPYRTHQNRRERDRQKHSTEDPGEDLACDQAFRLRYSGQHEAELSNLPKANRQLPCARWCLTHARKNVGGKDFSE